MNLLEVGALLKRERERCGISIRDVMDATKISRRNLTALEEGQLESLPHPVYLKGYLRNIARMVRLDADEMAQVVDQQYDSELGRYLPQTPAAAPVVVPAAAPAAAPASVVPAAESVADPVPPRPEQRSGPAAQRHSPEPERESRPRFAPEPLVASKPKISGTVRSVIVLILLVAALAVLLVQYQRKGPDAPPPPAAPPVVSAVNATAPDNASTALDNASDEANQPAPAGGDMPAAPPAPESARVPAPAAAPATAPAAPSISGTSIEVSRRTPAAALDAPARAPGVQTLAITAKPGEICWVGVYEGAKGTSFTLRNGESRQVEFAKRASLRLGN